MLLELLKRNVSIAMQVRVRRMGDGNCGCGLSAFGRGHWALLTSLEISQPRKSFLEAHEINTEIKGEEKIKKGVKEEMSKKDKRTSKVVGTRGLSGDSIESKEDSQVSNSSLIAKIYIISCLKS